MRLKAIRTAIVLATAGLAFAAAGCGDDSSADEESAAAAPEAGAFPAPDGGTLEDLTAEAEPTNEIVVAPANQVFTEGRNRLGFAVFTVEREQITDADVAIYAAPGPEGKAAGPFPARVETLETEPAFTAQTTSGDPDAAKAVYVADLQLDQPGEWRLLALVSHDGELSATRMPSIVVDGSVVERVPEVGERAPAVHTPTTDDVGRIEEIDTRVPPSSMHDVDLADAIGERPAVLMFATPALCSSRVCGPVVDVAEQVKRDSPDDIAFIHMEIYEDNTPPEVRPQVKAFGLPTEPWTFVIDCDGRIDTRIEGALSVSELTAAVDRVADSC